MYSLASLLPDRGLSNVKRSGMKSKKVWLTYAFTTNANSSEKLPPLIIRKAQKAHAFRNITGTQLGFHYQANAKAWMTTKLYQEWISDWDQKLRAKGRHILLLQDNFSGHIPPEGLTNICVENFTPNLTTLIQPMDQGIICVTFSDYLFRLLYADYHWDCIFLLSWSTHTASTLTLVLLHRDLLYHCTIRSDLSAPCPCTVISWSLYDTICY